MARKHTFFIVVLLSAAALAAFAVLARSADLAEPAAATATPALSQSELDARLRELDRFEAQLRKQLAAKPKAPRAAPAAVLTQAAPAAGYDDEADDDHGGHEDDDD